MNLPRDTKNWEVPESEITDWIYTLIDLFGIENVRAFRARAMGYLMYERDAMILAYRGEILRDHVAVTERVSTWRSNLIPAVQSHAPPVHPFDSEQRSLAILDGMPYISPDVSDDAPTLDGREYEQWLQATFRKEQRRHDKEASKERSVRWHQMRQDPRHESEDCMDFLHRKRDNEAQHHRARRDEPNNNTYSYMSPVGPSGSRRQCQVRHTLRSTSPQAPAIPNSLSDVAESDSCPRY